MSIVKCPFCGEEIQSTAKKCKHCGEWLNNHCPVCGEIIPPNSPICPNCNSRLKKQQEEKSFPILKILSILSIFGCILATLICSFVCILSEPKEVATTEFKSGMLFFYCIFLSLPYPVPIIAMCLEKNNKIQITALSINTVLVLIFLFSLIFAR